MKRICIIAALAAVGATLALPASAQWRHNWGWGAGPAFAVGVGFGAPAYGWGAYGAADYGYYPAATRCTCGAPGYAAAYGPGYAAYGYDYPTAAYGYVGYDYGPSWGYRDREYRTGLGVDYRG